jgi:hypothetical protein
MKQESPQDEQEYGEHDFKFEYYYMCHAFIKDRTFMGKFALKGPIRHVTTPEIHI